MSERANAARMAVDPSAGGQGRSLAGLIDVGGATVSTGSIGAVAVAPSNANIIYVGSGEGLQRPDLLDLRIGHRQVIGGEHDHVCELARFDRAKVVSSREY